MLSTIVSIIVILLVCSILWWAITSIPLPEPVATVVRVAFAVIVALAILAYFFGGAGTSLGCGTGLRLR